MTTTNSKALAARKLVLLISGTIAIGIAATILFAHDSFYAAYGIELAGNTNLTNELKAPAGTLLVAGLFMFTGMLRTEWNTAALFVAAAVYLSYGLSRFMSIAVDGTPHEGLVGAAFFEIAVGAACLIALIPGRNRGIAYQTN